MCVVEAFLCPLSAVVLMMCLARRAWSVAADGSEERTRAEELW